MKVVGLLSGGKDSCYNLMHCVANGHEIVALATLVPEDGVDELDSYLYQSVGTGQILPLIAQAMRLPLYRATIKGKPVCLDLNYGNREGTARPSSSSPAASTSQSPNADDETEDLYDLLRRVKKDHPDLAAVSTGAILSNYQRTRIEHVCGRPELALTCLGYLWQRPERTLVDEMIRTGLVAVLVKVAGFGLVEDDVGKTLAQMRPKLGRLEDKFGCHVAGEGGEYETVTLDCPLFHEKIQIDESEVVVTDPSPVAYLRLKRLSLVPKAGHKIPSQAELAATLFTPMEDEEEVPGLTLFDEVSRRLLKSLPKPSESIHSQTFNAASSSNIPKYGQSSTAQCALLGRHGEWFCVTVEGTTNGDETIEEEVTRVFHQAADTLAQHHLSLTQIQHQNFLLSSMSDFPAANRAYSRFFGSSPPSRACVAVSLPDGQRVRLEAWGLDDKALAATDTRKRSALHVQSMSYWAPANIGPYSQAVMCGNRLTIAGQIGLQPSTLTLPEPQSFEQEAVLAMQHVRRVVEVLQSPQTAGGGWEGWCEGVICWYQRSSDLAIAQSAWSATQEELGWEKAPCLFVQAAELPKGALVEWQAIMHTGRWNEPSEDREPKLKQLAVARNLDMAYGLTASDCGSNFSILGCQVIEDGVDLPEDLLKNLKQAFSLRVFHPIGTSPEDISRIGSLLKSHLPQAAVSYIPTQSVQFERESYAFGIVALGA